MKCSYISNLSSFIESLLLLLLFLFLFLVIFLILTCRDDSKVSYEEFSGRSTNLEEGEEQEECMVFFFLFLLLVPYVSLLPLFFCFVIPLYFI